MRTGILAALLLVSVSAADADAQVWTDWLTPGPGSVTGEMIFGSALDVTYLGDYEASRTYTDDPATAWSWDYAIYDVAGPGTRPGTRDQVALSRSTTSRILFSRPVVDPFIAIMSQGRTGLPVTYSFTDPFTVLTEGQGYWGDGTYSTDAACGPDGACASASTVITGREFHGMIQFSGTFTELAWTSSPDEFWHSITVGAHDAVVTPEPWTGALLLSGLLGLGFVGLRRREDLTA